jgi:hypothetical protein
VTEVGNHAPKALVEKRLAEALADLKHGCVHGPYRSVKDLVRSLSRGQKSSPAWRTKTLAQPQS